MSGGTIAWTIMSVGLISAYVLALRDQQASWSILGRQAAIWAGVITAMFLIIRSLTS